MTLLSHFKNAGKILPTLGLIFLTVVFQLGVFPLSQAESSLSDIANSPYKASIEYLAEHGMVSGNPDGTFAPTSFMTRAEFITIITRAFGEGKDIGDQKNCFTDVHAEWYAKYICFAKANHLVAGYPDGTFKPAGTVSFVEGMAMAMTSSKLAPTAIAGTHAWYEPFYEYAHLNNIFSKYAMLPDAKLTREKAAFLLHQVYLIHTGDKIPATVRKNFSAACGANPPTIVPTSSMVDGVKRTYITAIPSSYEKNTPIKIVFAFHGRTNSNSDVRKYYKVEEAAKGKAIFVYPAGLPQVGGGYSWGKSDFSFFDQLVKEFSNNYCIDMDQIFVVGHSLGGWFTSELGNARGDVIRGIAEIGGGDDKHTTSNGPVASMIWHNPKDNLVPFSAGETERDNVIRQNQCSSITKPVEPLWAKCVEYQGCGESAPLVWCPHTEDYAYWDKSYYPHTWPKNAGAEIWKFFEGLN